MDSEESAKHQLPPDHPDAPPIPFGEPDPADDPNHYPYATWGPWIAFGGAIMALIVGMLLSLPIVVAGGDDFDSLGWGAKAAVQFCTGLGFFLVPSLIAYQFPSGVNWRQVAGRLGFRKFKIGEAAKWIGIAYLSYIIFVVFYVAVIGEPQQDDIAGELGPLWSQIFLIVIVAPFAEEVCFRGMLFGGLRRRFKWPVAALAVGLFFGSLHFSTGVSAVPVLIVLGALFALVYEKTRSIWPAIIFHMINNAYVLIALNV